MEKENSHLIIHHQPVFLDYLLKNILQSHHQKILDGTLGEGGHAEGFLKKGRKVFGLDRDLNILNKAKKRLADFSPKIEFFQGNHVFLDKVLPKVGNFDLILFDLGISKYHYFESGKGFSFLKDEYLDMSLDSLLNPPNKIIDNKTKKISTKNINAYHIINKFPTLELSKIFFELGEETYGFSKKIAQLITEKRKLHPLETTLELSELIKKAAGVRGKKSKINPATKIFQALRIFVNDELSLLPQAINGALKRLNPQGTLLIITYHSLEDRIVKNKFNEFCKKHENYNKYKQKKEIGDFFLLNKKVIKANWEEIKKNPAARSAKLRGIIKR